jgi:hypothetical protein
MAVNVSKTKYIIFHTRGKPVDNTVKIFYNDNEPDESFPERIYELERIHNNQPVPANRSTKIYPLIHILNVPDTASFTSEDKCKWYWHQMIYFPETINTISTTNTTSPTPSLVSS